MANAARAAKGRFPRLKLIWADSGYKKGGFVSGSRQRWAGRSRLWNIPGAAYGASGFLKEWR